MFEKLDGEAILLVMVLLSPFVSILSLWFLGFEQFILVIGCFCIGMIFLAGIADTKQQRLDDQKREKIHLVNRKVESQ